MDAAKNNNNGDLTFLDGYQCSNFRTCIFHDDLKRRYWDDMATNQINVWMLKTMPDEMLLIEKNASRSRHYDGSLMILREFIQNNETITGVRGYTNTNDDDEGVGGHWGSTPDMTTKVNTLLLDSCMKFCTRWCNRRFFLQPCLGTCISIVSTTSSFEDNTWWWWNSWR